MNNILKYLCFVLFGIIIYLLIRNRCKKERFSIGGQITTDCNSKNMYDRIMDIQNHYDSSGSESTGDNQVHRIGIKSIDDNKRYQEIVVLTQNVKDFLHYNSSFQWSTEIFNINISRLLNRIRLIISNICLHDNMNPYLDYILSGYYDSDNIFFPCQDVNNYGCLYIYLDDRTVVNFNNDSETSPFRAESGCDICKFSNLRQSPSTPHGRDYCVDIIDLLDGNKPQGAIALSDLYHYNYQDPSFIFRQYEQPVLLHEFAHIILEIGVVKSNSSKRIDFNCIYDHYKDYVDLQVNSNPYGVSGGTCAEIYACYGNCSKWSGLPNTILGTCLHKGRELFAMASETWFGVNNSHSNAGKYLENILNLFNKFPDLYKYLESIYGPPNNLCVRFGDTELNHYHVCGARQAPQGWLWTDVGDLDPSAPISSSSQSLSWGCDGGAAPGRASCSLKAGGKYASQKICNCNCERSQSPQADFGGLVGGLAGSATVLTFLACAASRHRQHILRQHRPVPIDDRYGRP